MCLFIINIIVTIIKGDIMIRYSKKTNIPTFKYSTIALTLFTLNSPSLAQQNTTSLDTINISENLDSRTSNTPNIS